MLQKLDKLILAVEGASPDANPSHPDQALQQLYSALLMFDKALNNSSNAAYIKLTSNNITEKLMRLHTAATNSNSLEWQAHTGKIANLIALYAELAKDAAERVA